MLSKVITFSQHTNLKIAPGGNFIRDLVEYGKSRPEDANISLLKPSQILRPNTIPIPEDQDQTDLVVLSSCIMAFPTSSAY
jgi:hypothetical protein